MERRRIMKILVAGFRHESNTFAPSKATYASFAADGGRYPLSRGAEIGRLKGMNLPVAGALAALDDAGHVALPATWADATPSGRVDSVAFERIAGEIVDAAKRRDADGIYVDLHGAMATERYDDGEGELLRRLRETVGARVPIVASLDLHANVTQQMLDSADGLVTYRTYPHVDMAETGRRAVALLDALLGRRGRHRHFSSARRVPFLIPVNAMCTSLEPSKSLFRLLERLETGSVRSLSFAPGFPAADFPECGPTIWGYGADPVQLARAVDALYEHVVSAEAQWSVPFMSADDAVTEAIRIARRARKPVVIADTQDNPGAGGGSNTTGLLRALVRHRAPDAALGLFFDPAAACAAHAAGLGASVEITLGADSGLPFTGTFRVESLSNGRCHCNGPMLRGATFELGPTACLRIGDVRVVVTSARVQMTDRSFYRIAGIAPETMKILVNKSSVHFRADFDAIADCVLIAKAGGWMAADPADLRWTSLADGMRTSPCGAPFFGCGGRHAPHADGITGEMRL
ncbi:M81 family metallopeptidase [Burkholderia thailandensis]|nr:M81 family metallopeptidase [Burkholderia thailandensis]MBS2129765.1 M81 family metallopeptidase [Burkholderia thailandensis]MCS3398407.1 M81 family metallopeptidase [Burkholderia thailandensis]MCS6472618.1 M81 family metallopeptidase [Burkholderia thailandensis]MCS6477631.1 M81 family metallopeptidase [Burkholderia thailandensis]MCS6503519.1 M81 family metallopeptidase [Burkholderia thailandensis]